MYLITKRFLLPHFFAPHAMQLLLPVLLLWAGSLAASVDTVYVYNNQFSVNPPGFPIENAVISEGDTILWLWLQGGHTTTSVAASPEQWDAPITSVFTEFSYQFNTAGVYWYYCIPHGNDDGDGTASGMAGTITVLSAGQGACCMPNAMCMLMSEADCLNSGGTFHGAGSTCQDVQCISSLSLSAAKDNILYEDANGSLSNGAGIQLYVGNQNSGLKRRTVIAFDLSFIPESAVVTDAHLWLYCNSASGNAQDVYAHRLLNDWGEGTSDAPGNEGTGAPATTGDATWLNTHYPDMLWDSGGGDYEALASATTSVAGNNTFYAWTSPDLIADVQHWVHMPLMNFGWLLKDNEVLTGVSRRFDSRQSATPDRQPYLEITFYIPETGACCMPDATCMLSDEMSCTMMGGTFHGVGTECGEVYCPVQLTPYLDALPLPAVAQPISGIAGGEAYYELAMTEQFQTLHSELPPTRTWGYAGSYPGPTIEAYRDQPVTVTWINDLRVAETGELRSTHALPVDTCLHGPNMTGQVPYGIVHLHGGKVAPESDGNPDFAFPPGESSPVYTYPNDQPAAPLWYHDHALGITRLNVMMGMAGIYLLRDDAEMALNLPSGEYEVPLVIQDRSFNPDGSLYYPEMWHEHFFGDKILVNGKVWPYLNVKQGKYRFRLFNGSNSRTYTLSLSNGATFTLIGTDLGLVEAPLGLTELTITPGERADIILDFSALAAGTEVLLQNSAPAPFPGFPGIGVVPEVMKFTVLGEPGYTGLIPPVLAEVPVIEEQEASQERVFHLMKMPSHGCGNHHDGMWTINGLMWDDITEYPVLGTTEIWDWRNTTGMVHPMHMHLVMFQILDRQELDAVTGDPIGPKLPPGDHEKGWKDTANCPTGYSTRIIARFVGFTGLYPYHCHILEHEDHEMMRQFMVVAPELGCTDSLACNYDPLAQEDDGSCTYPGCMDMLACNYNALAGCDDGSCLFLDACGNCGGADFAGCTDPLACNYDVDAGCDDGSCDFSCLGCTVPIACNYNSLATIDDGSCDFTACAGCIYDTASNYNATASINDGSCIFPQSVLGCVNPDALNYDPTATFDDGSCEFVILSEGCTYSDALNFNPQAEVDNGSCEFPECDNQCIADLNGDGVVNSSDLSIFLSAFGTFCP